MTNQLFIPSIEASITNSFVALLGAAPGATYMTLGKSLGATNTTQALINYTGITSASELTDLIARNLGLSSVYPAKDYIYDQIVNAGGVSKAGGVILETLNLFTTLTNNSTYGTYANTYITKLNTALAYSLVSSNNSTDLNTLTRAISSSNSSSNTVTSSSSSETVTFTMSPTATSMNEGAHNLIVVSSTNTDPGSTLAYTISGIDPSRLSSGSLSGVLTLDSYGQAVIDLGVMANLQTDGATTVTVSLVNGLASTRISVTDSSRTPETISPSFTLSAASSSLNEGSRNLITLTTANIATGSQFSYSISGIDPARLSTGSLAGTFTTDANGRAILDLGVLSNNQTDGSTTVRLSLANGLAATAFTVNDTSTSSSNSSNSNSNSTPETLALTTDSETIELTDSEIVTGTLATSGTYSDGDVISGESESILRLTASGSNTAIAEVNGIGDVRIILNADSSIDMGLWSDVGLLSLTGGTSLKTFTLLNADLNTTYGIASSRQQTLVIDYDESGSNNTAFLKLAGSGLPTTNNTEHLAVIDISANNSIDNISLTTSGINYAEIIANTDVDTFTISGNGTNHLLITSQSETHLDIDMSTSSGRNTVDIGSILNNTTTITGGSGIDAITAAIEIVSSDDGYRELAPHLSDIESLNLSVIGSGQDNEVDIDAQFMDDIESIQLDTPGGDIYLGNASSSLHSVTIIQTDANGNTDIGIAYDDEDSLGDLAINIGAVDQAQILINELNLTDIGHLTINAVENTDIWIYNPYIANDSFEEFEVNNTGTGTLALDRPIFVGSEGGYVTFSVESFSFSSTQGGTIEAGNFWAGSREEGGTFLPRSYGYLTPALSNITLEADNSGALYIADIAAFYVEDESEGYEYSSLSTIDLHAGYDSTIYMGRVYAGGASVYEMSVDSDYSYWGTYDDTATNVYIEAENNALINWGGEDIWNETAYVGGYIDELSIIAKTNSSIEIGEIQVIGEMWDQESMYGSSIGGNIGSITIEAQEYSYVDAWDTHVENDIGDITISASRGAEVYADFAAGDDSYYEGWAYGSIGNIQYTASDNAGYTYLDFYAKDHGAYWVDLGLIDNYAYDGYSTAAAIGDISITIGTDTEDQNFYFESDGSIGDVTMYSDSENDTELYLFARDSIGTITLSGDGDFELHVNDEPDWNLYSLVQIDASDTNNDVYLYVSSMIGSEIISGSGYSYIELADNEAADTIIYKENYAVGSTTGSLINGKYDNIEGFDYDDDSIQFGISDTSFVESLIGLNGSDEYLNGGSEVIYLEAMANASTFTHGVQGAIEFYDNGSDLIIAINTNHNTLLDDRDIVIALIGVGISAGETSWGFTLNETGNLYIT